MANLSDRIRSKIDGTGGLLPVGSIVAYSPGYYTSSGNGGSFNVVGPVANTVAQINAYLPSEWRVCDGTAPNDAESPIFNAADRFMPDITGQRFVRGHTAAGAVGGATGNAITLNVSQLPNHDHPAGTLVSDNANAPHSHPASSDTQNAPHGHLASTTVNEANAPHGHQLAWGINTGGGTGIIHSGAESTTPSQFNQPTDIDNAPHSHTASTTVNEANAPHSHGITVNEQNAPHTHSISGLTGAVGSGSSVDITPQYINVFYIMRIK